MKKFIVLLIAMTGFFTSDISAQSCCTVKKECKPKQCCPTTPSCCKDTKVLGKSNFKETGLETERKIVSPLPPKTQQVLVVKKKVLPLKS